MHVCCFGFPGAGFMRNLSIFLGEALLEKAFTGHKAEQKKPKS
jgi:hypothetical protein